MPDVKVFPESHGLYREAAERLVRAGRKAIEREGRFTLLLAGGSTPRRLYALLAAPEYRERADWSRTHLFWGDERAVPISHPQSNFRMASETLLSRLSFPEQNIHRVPAELGAEEAAAQYERELLKFFGGPPRFDLALLGMGADGHTASLFPGSNALREAARWVVAAAAPQGAARITLTLPALSAAAEVLFLVTGAAKAPALAAALEGPPDPDLPAALVKPARGEVVWLVDGAAAAYLRKHAQASL